MIEVCEPPSPFHNDSRVTIIRVAILGWYPHADHQYVLERPLFSILKIAKDIAWV